MGLSLRDILKNNLPFLLIVLFITAAAYSAGIKASFVTADDMEGYVNYQLIRSFGDTLATKNVMDIYKATLYVVAELNSTALHTIEFIFHISIVFLAFIFTYLYFGKKAAAIATPLFALHPINTEAVYWLSASQYKITTFFSLLIFISFYYYKEKANKLAYFISLAILAILLGTQYTLWVIVIAPILVLLDLFVLSKKIKKSTLVELLPVLLMELLFIIIYVVNAAQTRLSTLQDTYQFVPATIPYYMRAAYSFFKTFELYTFPLKLSLFHVDNGITYETLFIMFLATITILGITTAMLFSKNSRIYGLLIAITVITVSPIFSPIQVSWLVAERYMYFGSIFFCILLSLILIEMFETNSKVLIGATIVIMLLYGTRVFIRGLDWKTNLALWQATAKTAPTSDRVFNNLGDAYVKENNVDASIEAFKKAIEINPEYSDAYHNLGNSYVLKNELTNAKDNYLKSLQYNPNLYQSYYELGLIAKAEKEIEQAREYAQKAIDLNKDFAPAIQLQSELQ